MALESYRLDQAAHDLVIKYRDDKEALSQAYKMRIAVAYGLERFWGEHLRLNDSKSDYWKDTWTALVEIMSTAGIDLPNDEIISDRDTDAIRNMAEKIWSFDDDQRKVALAVLTELCESMVWWTQRYKK
jgi:hypothetical protein